MLNSIRHPRAGSMCPESSSGWLGSRPFAPARL